jgi:hypothetical protein
MRIADFGLPMVDSTFDKFRMARSKTPTEHTKVVLS